MSNAKNMHTYSPSGGMKSNISQKHRITEPWGLEGASGDHLVQPHSKTRVSQSRLLRTVSRCVLSISRNGAFTTSLEITVLVFDHLYIKKVCSNGTSSISVCAHCLLSFHWATPRSLLLPLYSLPSGILKMLRFPPESSLLKAKQSQLYSACRVTHV